MADLAAHAVSTMSKYRSNEIIMAFVTQEAHEKVAAEISAIPGRCATAKAVKILAYSPSNDRIIARIEEYVTAGLFGCYLASIS